MEPIVLRVVARFQVEAAEVEADRGEFFTPRPSHLPPEVRGTDPWVPEGTDLAIWKWEQPGVGGVIKPFAIAFAGKQNKPLWYHSFRDESQRERMIDETIRNRKQYIDRMKQRAEERKNFEHGLKVGDILYSSWGYDQTNINFYQVTEVRGKEVVIREIASKLLSSDGYGSDKVTAVPNHFIGPELRRRPQGSAGHMYVKIDGSQSGWLWDGKPERATSSGWGH